MPISVPYTDERLFSKTSYKWPFLILTYRGIILKISKTSYIEVAVYKQIVNFLASTIIIASQDRYR